MSRVKQPEEGGSESLTVNMPIVMPLSEQSSKPDHDDRFEFSY
jgi:hypothetical protein